MGWTVVKGLFRTISDSKRSRKGSPLSRMSRPTFSIRISSTWHEDRSSSLREMRRLVFMFNKS